MRTLLAVPFLLLAACATESSPDVSESELSIARSSFAANIPGSYTFQTERSCNCLAEQAKEMRVTVTNGQITAATYVDSGDPVPVNYREGVLTIGQVFDQIQRAIDDGAASLTVQFDPTIGFPTTVEIDFDAGLADEELSLRIRNVVPLAE